MQYGVNVSPIKGSSEKDSRKTGKNVCFLYFVSFMFYL